MSWLNLVPKVHIFWEAKYPHTSWRYIEITIFGLKMMLKSGLEKIILKFHKLLQSCCCPMQKCLPKKAELAWLVCRYLWRGSFKIFFSTPLSPWFFSQKNSKPKIVVSRVKILVHLCLVPKCFVPVQIFCVRKKKIYIL
jgi:hypothetical protein